MPPFLSEPVIQQLPAMKAVGLSTLVSMKTDHASQIPALWERYGKCYPIPNAVEPWIALGIQNYPDDFMTNFQWFYTAAAVVSSFDNIPLNCVAKSIPANTYAVFTHKGPLPGKLGESFQYIYRTWLPASGYKISAPYDFERYDSRFKGVDNPETLLDICIPVSR